MARLDRTGKRRRWDRARAAESMYNNHLRAVARQVGMIVRGLAPKGLVKDLPALVKALHDYARLLDPWAKSVANLMLAEVARRNEQMWRANSKDMGRQLRQTVTNSAITYPLQALQDEQVRLIKSLPLEAAQRVQDLAVQSLSTSSRASELAKAIMQTGHVTESRARLIARTETSRAASNLLQARSEYAGSEGYIWRTSGDMDVRDSHKEMDGKYVRWSSPPTLDGMKGHAGCLPNCRCFAEPVFPND